MTLRARETDTKADFPSTCAVIAVVTLSLCAPASAQMPCRYEVTVIEGPAVCSIGGGDPTPAPCVAKAITEDGVVAGEQYGCLSPGARPFFWTQAEGYQLPPNLAGSSDTTVEAINMNREIAGTCVVPQNRGFVRNASGQYLDLPIGPNGTEGWTYGINNAGICVGTWGNGVTGPNPVPCKWVNGQLIDLSGVLSSPIGIARELNSAGQITGWIGTSAHSDGRAFILDGDQVIILPAIPGGNSSEGAAINDRGDVAGTGWFIPPIRHAFLCMDGQAYDLGTLPGFSTSSALDVNNHRVVAGTSGARAWVWQDGVMRDLNTLIPSQPTYVVKRAHAINDAGEIACEATIGSVGGRTIGMLLRPVYASPADLNGDCAINSLDLGILLTDWSIPPTSPACGGSKSCPADLNGDGFINTLDLGILLVNWSLP